MPELIMILIVALVVLGPERLPELARQLGTFIRTARRMYANLRAELGPEFDDIEQGIRELRSLDPRQQVRDYSRALLDDISTDAPEIKQIATAPKVDLEQLGRSVLGDNLLDKPLAETRATEPSPPSLPIPNADEAFTSATEASSPSLPASNGDKALNNGVQATQPVTSTGSREVTTNHFE